jgi:Spy/CpxP family protein refolding chaperone
MNMQGNSFVALVLAGFLIAAAPAAVAAQSFKWWQTERFQRELALSEEQIDRLEQIFQSKEPKLRQQKHALDDLEKALSTMVAEGRADEVSAEALIDRVEAARSTLSKSRTLMLFKMRRILTSDQHVKLKVLGAEWERERRSRGGHHRESGPGDRQ